MAGGVWWQRAVVADDVVWILSVNNEDHDVLGAGPSLAILKGLLFHYSNPPNNNKPTQWWQSNSFYPRSSSIPFTLGVGGRTGFNSHRAFNFSSSYIQTNMIKLIKCVFWYYSSMQILRESRISLLLCGPGRLNFADGECWEDPVTLWWLSTSFTPWSCDYPFHASVPRRI